MRTKSCLSVVLIALLLFSALLGALPISAKDSKAIPLPPDTSAAKTVYLYNFENDRAIVERNTAQRISPASTVKIATGLLAMERLEHRLDEIITVTEAMLKGIGGSVSGLRVGDRLSIRDLLYVSICGGYNDATNILACLVGGSSASFTIQLNERIREWGCRETHYTNPTGMDESGAYTTLEDIITLSKRAIETPLYMTISSAISYSFSLRNRDEIMLVYNRNALISPYYHQGCQSKYAKGLIAGMTDMGGYCVVTYAEYADSRYLCIVMGATGTSQGLPSSFAIAYRLLQYAYLNCVYTPIAKAGDVMGEATVRLALPKDKEGVATVPCVLQKDLYALLPEDTKPEDLTFRSYFHTDALQAPVSAGQVVGGTDVYYGDTWICHGKLIVSENIEANAALRLLNWLKHQIFSRRTLITVLIFLVMLAVYLPLSRHMHRKRGIRLDFRTQNAKKTPKPPTG